jgi:tRNA (cmo5U34)-methyltransferase
MTTGRYFDFDSDYGLRYDDFVRRSIVGYEALHTMVLALLQSRLGDIAQLLVVGSGTGAELLTLGSAMPDWAFTGVDPSEQMTRLAGEKVETAGLAGRVRLHTGTTASLPADEMYDAATLILVMHFVADQGPKLDLLRSISQRLRPGACYVHVDLHGDTQSAGFRQLMAAWKNFQLLMGVSAEQAEVVQRAAIESHHFISEQRTLALLGEAGFGNVERFFQGFVTAGWIAQKL